MKWIIDNVRNSIWGFFADLVADILNNAFQFITEFILSFSDINAYFDITRYVKHVQILAGFLLALTIVFEVFKRTSGMVDDGEEKTISQLTMQTLWAAFFIYFLPLSVTEIFMRANTLLIRLIASIGIDIAPRTISSSNAFSAIMGTVFDAERIMQLGATMIVGLLVLGCALLFLGIVAGIRYVELLITILISPICAISVVRKGEGLKVWVLETTAIVFTQAIHFLLLQFLVTFMMLELGLVMLLLSIATLVVGLRGPQTLRKYLYSSGTGSASISMAGQVSRFTLMKNMLTR